MMKRNISEYLCCRRQLLHVCPVAVVNENVHDGNDDEIDDDYLVNAEVIEKSVLQCMKLLE